MLCFLKLFYNEKLKLIRTSLPNKVLCQVVVRPITKLKKNLFFKKWSFLNFRKLILKFCQICMKIIFCEFIKLSCYSLPNPKKKYLKLIFFFLLPANPTVMASATNATPGRSLCWPQIIFWSTTFLSTLFSTFVSTCLLNTFDVRWRCISWRYI